MGTVCKLVRGVGRAGRWGFAIPAYALHASTAFTCVETGALTFAVFGSAERFTLIEGSRPLLWRRGNAKTATCKRAMRYLKPMET